MAARYAAAIVSVARAEMGADAHRSPAAPGDDAERQRVRETIEAERREEAAREAERVARAQQEKERITRMQARRPDSPAEPPRADAPAPKTDKHAAPSRPPRLEPLVKPRQGTQPAPLGLCDGS